MKLPRRRLLCPAAGAAVLALMSLMITMTARDAWSQATRTIKIVVPYAPGGAGSVLAHLLAEQIDRTQKTTMVIENRPGAGTAIATEAVARATPDGTTLLITNTPFLINPILRKLNYDPLAGFEPICNLVNASTFIVVNSASPYRTLDDLLNAARAKPGEVTVAGFVGTTVHIGFEMLKRRADVNMTMVPYTGSAPAVNALLGGHVTSLIDNYVIVAEQINAGKLRALATLAGTRIESQPDVPTVAESGFPGFGLEAWWAVFAPANLPKDMASQFADWFAAALQAPEVKARLTPIGLDPIKMCGADFAAFLRKQHNDYGRIIREVNIKVE
jgi:tripartite-type tricarboxylate transporter receptor subunit TctC